MHPIVCASQGGRGTPVVKLCSWLGVLGSPTSPRPTGTCRGWQSRRMGPWRGGKDGEEVRDAQSCRHPRQEASGETRRAGSVLPRGGTPGLEKCVLELRTEARVIREGNDARPRPVPALLHPQRTAALTPCASRSSVPIYPRCVHQRRTRAQPCCKSSALIPRRPQAPPAPKKPYSCTLWLTGIPIPPQQPTRSGMRFRCCGCGGGLSAGQAALASNSTTRKIHGLCVGGSAKQGQPGQSHHYGDGKPEGSTGQCSSHPALPTLASVGTTCAPSEPHGANSLSRAPSTHPRASPLKAKEMRAPGGKGKGEKGEERCQEEDGKP